METSGPVYLLGPVPKARPAPLPSVPVPKQSKMLRVCGGEFGGETGGSRGWTGPGKDPLEWQEHV